MKKCTRFLLIFALLLTAVSSLSASADHGFAAPAAAASTSDPVQDAWWGGAAAIGCGFGMRFWPAFGWNLGYNALVTIACFAMILDAATSI